MLLLLNFQSEAYHLKSFLMNNLFYIPPSNEDTFHTISVLFPMYFLRSKDYVPYLKQIHKTTPNQLNDYKIDFTKSLSSVRQ